MENNEMYLILAKIKLLMEEYEENNDKKINYIMQELGEILNNVEIPSKYLIAEGFDNIYKKTKK
jgi:hypothetical protein